MPPASSPMSCTSCTTLIYSIHAIAEMAQQSERVGRTRHNWAEDVAIMAEVAERCVFNANLAVRNALYGIWGLVYCYPAAILHELIAFNFIPQSVSLLQIPRDDPLCPSRGTQDGTPV